MGNLSRIIKKIKCAKVCLNEAERLAEDLRVALKNQEKGFPRKEIEDIKKRIRRIEDRW